MWMHPQLAEILDILSTGRARWALLAASTPDDRWAARNRPAEWSVAENIAHLNLSARAMHPLLVAAAESVRTRGPYHGRLRRTVLGAILSATMGPVPRIGGFRLARFRTPPPFVPGALDPRATISAEFERHFDAHEKAVRDADGLPLHLAMMDSPFAPGKFYDAYSGWLVVARHIHRHLVQAERVWGP